MHEPDIAPLARRLAEENNVDWRHLSGSGDGGRVVERDVLGYLARVMAGEEDVDPTPEPVPDGMVAWPEDDVAAYRARGAHASEDESPPTLDDELFLFDEPAVEAATSDALDLVPDPSEPEHGNGAFAAEDGALLLVGDEGDRDGAPSRDGGDAWSADAGRIDELPDLTEASAADDEPLSDDLPPPGTRSSYALPDLFASDDAPSETPEEPDLLFDDAAGEPLGGDGSWSADDAGDPAPMAGDGSWSADDAGDPAPMAGDGSWSADDAGDLAPMAGDGSWSAGEEVDAEVRPASDVPFVPFGDGATEAAAGITIGMATAPDGAARPAPAVADLPGVAFVRHGQVWRRRFDDRPLRKAVSEVATELQASPSAVTAVLLARAAWRSGAVTGPIDVLRWNPGRTLRGPASGDLRTAVSGLAQTAGSGDAAAVLVVADLSQLDLDEAVLHLDAPVLAMGRSLGEGAWLCLSGDDVDHAVVSALGGIAELLTSPVRLLV